MLLCGGKGSRLAEQGVDTHKPLMPILGKPSLFHVVEQLLAHEISFNPILVVVPPDRLNEYESALHEMNCKVVVQPAALGTGDAVYQAMKYLPKGVSNLYVSFGTQPLVTDHSIRTSLLHHIENDLGFTMPTTITKNPYAPLLRDADGRVSNSVETHLEGATKPEFGEANVGAYWASMDALNAVLVPLCEEKWNSETGQYDTSSGELGYPNEMVRSCLANGFGVDGVVCSEPEEMIGLKRLEDIDKIEQFMLKREES